MPSHILVVDDDKRIRELLEEFLKGHGYIVSSAQNINQCKNILNDFCINLLIIDVMLPDQSGVDFMKESKDLINCPVIMLSALGEVDDRITGLSSGANDYLSKPFEPKELLLRVRNLLNYKLKNSPLNKINLGSLKYDLNNHILSDESDNPINLSTNEKILLQYLAEHSGQIFSRDEVAALFPGTNLRSIDTLVARLRAKIEKNSKSPRFLQTIRGLGYVFRG